MMNLRNRIILLAALLAAAATSGWLAYSHLSSTPIRCTGDVEWTIGKNRFVGTVSWRMQHREGSTVINGKLFGQTVTEVNRTIYFHYSDHENARVLNNNRIVKTFADNADEADINATLPGFYRTPGRELSLMIDEYRGPGFLPRQTSLRFTVVKTRRKNRSHTLDRMHSQISLFPLQLPLHGEQEINMLYIFDLGNVIVDIDFNRVLGAWSDFSRVPLATLKQNFAMGETFHQHERGEISDEAFAERFCQEMGLSLSYEQFSHGWQAVFVAVRPEVIDIMHKLREQGHRVVVLSNTNRLHTTFWPEEYPEVKAAADKIYLSQEMGMRKPEARIYQAVLQAEGFTAADAVFFDDNADNIEGANQLGITSILVTGKETIPDYFAKQLC